VKPASVLGLALDAPVAEALAAARPGEPPQMSGTIPGEGGGGDTARADGGGTNRDRLQQAAPSDRFFFVLR
jgi:hypothetical protein